MKTKIDSIIKTNRGWEYEGILFKSYKEAYDIYLNDQSDSYYDLPANAKLEKLYDSNESKSFGHFLAQFLEKMSITDIAKAIGVKRQTVYGWMRGEYLPKKDKIDKMVSTFQCGREDIVSALIDNYSIEISNRIGIPICKVKEILRQPKTFIHKESQQPLISRTESIEAPTNNNMLRYDTQEFEIKFGHGS